MSVKQVSVFLENRPGSLEEVMVQLGKAGIDLIALSIADTTDFGILRAIVDEPDKAVEVVKGHGYTASITEVLAVAVSDTPGGLARALTLLREAGVSIEYLYSFVRRIDHNAIIIFRVDDPAKAEAALNAAGLRLLAQDVIRNGKS